MPDRPLPRYTDDRDVGGWVWWVLGVIGLAVVLPGFVAMRDVRAIAERDAAIAAERQCPLPAKDGDRVAVVIRHRAGQLVATCTPLADTLSPERGLQ